MDTATQLQRALALAHIFRELRDLEVAEARELHDAAARAQIDRVRVLILSHAHTIERTARAWNHRLIEQQRVIRSCLERRARLRFFVPVRVVLS